MHVLGPMYSGTLIADLISAVDRAEEVSRALRMRNAESTTDAVEPKSDACKCKQSEAEQFPQALGLSSADGNLGLLFIVHPQLVGTLEPGNDLTDTIDIHQIRSVSPPE